MTEHVSLIVGGSSGMGLGSSSAVEMYAQEDLARPAGARTPARVSILSPVRGLWSRLLREREVTRMVAMLKTLDDRTLKDIGIHRSQIEGVARHGDFYKS